MQNNSYYCELCNYTSYHKPGKYQHIKTIKHKRNVKNKNSNNSNNSNTPLSVNYKTADNKYLHDTQYMTHEIVITNPNLISTNPKIENNPFRCDICFNIFSTKSNLIRHKKQQICLNKDQKIVTKKNMVITNLLKNESQPAYYDNVNHKESQMNHKESQMNHKESQMNHKESQMNHKESIIKKDNNKKLFDCKYCGKPFNTNSNMHRHINNYCKEKINNDINIELIETKKKLALYENEANIIQNNNNYSNNYNTNNNYNKIDTMNMNNINNLNMNFGNVIPMETFLYNMEHVNKISLEDVNNLIYTSEHMGIDDIANCFEKIISKNCIEQTKNMVHENGFKMLPTIPVLCTDGSMRSHKERLLESWDTIYNDKHFVKMWDIVNNRVYELTNQHIYISKKHKKKLYARVKRKVTVDDLCMMNK